MVNGVFVPGGNYPLTLHTRWFTTLQLLFDLTVEANDAGQHVPVSPRKGQQGQLAGVAQFCDMIPSYGTNGSVPLSFCHKLTSC